MTKKPNNHIWLQNQETFQKQGVHKKKAGRKSQLFSMFIENYNEA